MRFSSVAAYIAVFVFGYFLADIGGKESRVTPIADAQQIANPTSSRATAYAPDPQRQEARKNRIDERVKGGWFQKVEFQNSLPHVWVKPVFFSLSADDKQRFIEDVFAYYFPISWATGVASRNEILVVFHATTKQEVGTYAIATGLRMD